MGAAKLFVIMICIKHFSVYITKVVYKVNDYAKRRFLDFQSKITAKMPKKDTSAVMHQYIPTLALSKSGYGSRQYSLFSAKSRSAPLFQGDYTTSPQYNQHYFLTFSMIVTSI